MADQMVALRVV
jgi:hypothetical protein